MTHHRGRKNAEEQYAERREVEGEPVSGQTGDEGEYGYGNEPIPGTYGGGGTETETPEAGTRAPPGSLPSEAYGGGSPGKCPICPEGTEHVPTCRGCGNPVTRCKCR